MILARLFDLQWLSHIPWLVMAFHPSVFIGPSFPYPLLTSFCSLMKTPAIASRTFTSGDKTMACVSRCAVWITESSKSFTHHHWHMLILDDLLPKTHFAISNIFWQPLFSPYTLGSQFVFSESSMRLCIEGGEKRWDGLSLL